MQNTGIIQPTLKDSDFIAGKGSPINFNPINESADWTPFLPTKEPQFIKFETSSCVTFSALNCIETQMNYMIAKGLIPDITLKSLNDWGYIDENDKFNCSDWFTARMSGTTKDGNRVDAVWDSIRNDGLLPEKMLRLKDCQTQTEYFTKYITPEMKAAARKILDVIEFKYEWVATGNCADPKLDYLKTQMQQAPLHAAHPLCSRDDQGKFNPCGTCVTQHATMIYNISPFYIEDLDQYEPYFNKYSKNYTFPWVMKGVITLTNKQQQMKILETMIAIYKKIVSLLNGKVT